MNQNYNLATNLPLRTGPASKLSEALAATTVSTEDLTYPDPSGPLAARQSVARWLQRVCGHGPVDPSLITLTNGTRHALALALLATEQWEPAVLVEERTYQGLRAMAQEMGVRCIDVAMDQHGMRPDALARSKKFGAATAVYVQPTLHNPTTATMPFSRRMEIAAVAEALNLLIIEGDVYSPLAWHGQPPLPPFSAIAPHRTVHAGGIGKILGPGLRMGWLVHPDAKLHGLVAGTIERQLDGLPSLWSSVVGRMMDDGTVDTLLDRLANAMKERAAIARKVIGPDLVTSGASLHAWLPCAATTTLERRLLARGVRVASSKRFVGSRRHADGIRLALGAEENIERLEEALRIVAEER
ncbi:PLP-dependent aminotransferase family protein [Luteibacter sp.]|uniref:aminotransferase-like domain-containing protein n=1 Tax=Luteibacter sp. TaxID=1886636 RepID=UPI002F3F8D98